MVLSKTTPQQKLPQFCINYALNSFDRSEFETGKEYYDVMVSIAVQNYNMFHKNGGESLSEGDFIIAETYALYEDGSFVDF